MRKLFSLFAALSLSAGLWALDNVPYVDMVVNKDAGGHVIGVTPVSKIANGVTEITGTSNVLSDGWYVINSSVSMVERQLDCQGDVRIILADGASLDMFGADYQACIHVTGTNSLTIYGQENQSGSMQLYGGYSASAIGGNEYEEGCNITINGGTISAEAGIRSAAIGGGGYSADGHHITINGGNINASAPDDGAAIGGGNSGIGHHIYINGGTVSAYGGAAYSTNALGNGQYVDPTYAQDIYISGHRFLWDHWRKQDNSLIAHTSSQDMTTILRAKNQVHISDATTEGHYAEDKGAYYTTFYNADLSCEVITSDVEIFTAALANEGGETVLNLYQLEGNVIPAGTAVILASANTDDIHYGPHYEDVSGITVPANSLSGTNEGTTVAANSVYTLASEGNVLAFYKYTGTDIPAHKAYLGLPAGVSAPRRICFGSNIATGVENNAVDMKAEKVMLDGQLLIRKNGQLYNIQGAVVK